MLYFMGIGFIAISLINFLHNLNIIINGIKINAIVVKTEKTSIIEGGDSYAPIFQYTVEENKYETRYSTGDIKYPNGSIVQIYYHKENPKKIMVPSDKKRTVTNVIFLIVGLVLIGTAHLGLWI